ncbi:rRNA primary transcript metabolism protein [Irineochytrium annulatum]|nr:rRNA primary transcript metabolism protein [Irineochytrium annulatum]
MDIEGVAAFLSARTASSDLTPDERLERAALILRDTTTYIPSKPALVLEWIMQNMSPSGPGRLADSTVAATAGPLLCSRHWRLLNEVVARLDAGSRVAATTSVRVPLVGMFADAFAVMARDVGDEGRLRDLVIEMRRCFGAVEKGPLRDHLLRPSPENMATLASNALTCLALIERTHGVYEEMFSFVTSILTCLVGIFASSPSQKKIYGIICSKLLHLLLHFRHRLLQSTELATTQAGAEVAGKIIDEFLFHREHIPEYVSVLSGLEAERANTQKKRKAPSLSYPKQLFDCFEKMLKGGNGEDLYIILDALPMFLEWFIKARKRTGGATAPNADFAFFCELYREARAKFADHSEDVRVLAINATTGMLQGIYRHDVYRAAHTDFSQMQLHFLNEVYRTVCEIEDTRTAALLFVREIMDVSLKARQVEVFIGHILSAAAALEDTDGCILLDTEFLRTFEACISKTISALIPEILDLFLSSLLVATPSKRNPTTRKPATRDTPCPPNANIYASLLCKVLSGARITPGQDVAFEAALDGLFDHFIAPIAAELEGAKPSASGKKKRKSADGFGVETLARLAVVCLCAMMECSSRFWARKVTTAFLEALWNSAVAVDDKGLIGCVLKAMVLHVDHVANGFIDPRSDEACCGLISVALQCLQGQTIYPNATWNGTLADVDEKNLAVMGWSVVIERITPICRLASTEEISFVVRTVIKVLTGSDGGVNKTLASAFGSALQEAPFYEITSIRDVFYDEFRANIESMASPLVNQKHPLGNQILTLIKGVCSAVPVPENLLEGFEFVATAKVPSQKHSLMAPSDCLARHLSLLSIFPVPYFTPAERDSILQMCTLLDHVTEMSAEAGSGILMTFMDRVRNDIKIGGSGRGPELLRSITNSSLAVQKRVLNAAKEMFLFSTIWKHAKECGRGLYTAISASMEHLPGSNESAAVLDLQVTLLGQITVIGNALDAEAGPAAVTIVTLKTVIEKCIPNIAENPLLLRACSRAFLVVASLKAAGISAPPVDMSIILDTSSALIPHCEDPIRTAIEHALSLTFKALPNDEYAKCFNYILQHLESDSISEGCPSAHVFLAWTAYASGKAERMDVVKSSTRRILFAFVRQLDLTRSGTYVCLILKFLKKISTDMAVDLQPIDISTMIMSCCSALSAKAAYANDASLSKKSGRRHVFQAICALLLSILSHRRDQLIHVIPNLVSIVRDLMNCFRLPADGNDGSFVLKSHQSLSMYGQPSLAIALSRILERMSQKQSSVHIDKNEDSSAKVKAFSKHATFLVAEYVAIQASRNPLHPVARDALVEGIYSLVDLCGEFGREAVLAGIDARGASFGGKATFKNLINDWTSYAKSRGKV